MNRKYTIKDIAALAGVSKGTVDRVLHKRGKVSEAALKKVNAILDEIDYQPNIIAQNLKQNKVFHICVLLPNPEMDNYWKRCEEGILNAKNDFAAFNVMVSIVDFDPLSTASFNLKHQDILKQQPDAVLLAPLFYKESKSAINDYYAHNIPVITFNNQVTIDAVSGFVGQDLVQSGRVAAKLFESMIKSGGLTIIHINEDITNAMHMQEKERGFRAFFETLHSQDFTISTLQVDAKKLHEILPDYLNKTPETKGLFITTSKSHLVSKLLEAKVIKDLVVIGYDLLEDNVNYLKSGWISYLINQNPKHQAYLGLNALAEHLIYQNPILKNKLLPIDIINSENVQQYLD
ncbi:LacI family DNA-binding transcriptional regulator [Formosa sp. S-31]|uniref:LacI family DNA-binding transcriptional regulator n=1 Tax=Formosa sp. S-31 TaxID=2790949 RepID=UPI003EBEEED4